MIHFQGIAFSLYTVKVVSNGLYHLPMRKLTL